MNHLEIQDRHPDVEHEDYEVEEASIAYAYVNEFNDISLVIPEACGSVYLTIPELEKLLKAAKAAAIVVKRRI